MTSAAVVGSGPNGLAAAITLARAGVEVTVLEANDTPGGGTRSVEATLPGLLHDECSGFHPLAVDTAFSRVAGLEASGLEWAWPTVQYSHPLDGGRGAAVVRSVAETAAGLGADEGSYRHLFGALDDRFDAIAVEFLQPVLHVPRHPFALARFGAYSLLPAGTLARRFVTPEARALWAGVAAHAFRPFTAPLSSAIGLALGTAAHHAGWPVAVGGSRAISDAMIRVLERFGGRIETGVRVASLDDCRRDLGADLVLLDTSPSAAVRIAGDRLPARVRCAYERYRHGPAAFQVAFAVEGGIPWTHEPSRRAGTVHVGGSFQEVAAAERDVARGRMPERPFVLLGQQYLADPGRSAGDVHPVDAYAHVPAGYTGDATEAITAQIERFAPGFRDRIRATTRRSTATIAADNHNYVGGDIVTGLNSARQLLLRPRATTNPYATGIDGVYLCSAATPPGAGAHGMCGHLAARAALAGLVSSR
ncbi:phytoene desaturase family protein [Nocardioides acrostichi]|uniref:NAD(P)/FAD-dependent oxidoreductase n=1 Tax=Nocardioides acrostichi TaxID=2784339 RepID=A0A930V087_9ACTN|nr:NAD(P)/FAD-dependent oxidoreductase [Nocardioides acrostichi]MBF4161357.1 NAD(P)/FAD-dependent oxidoreductase [Nocardioides acrostichi]